jgi:Na+-translocating ferredoxin:NAD+ oxidoreductase RnfA subunit
MKIVTGIQGLKLKLYCTSCLLGWLILQKFQVELCIFQGMFQELDYSTGKSIIMAIVILNSFKSWFCDAFSIHTNYVKVVFRQNLSGFNIKWMIKA